MGRMRAFLTGRPKEGDGCVSEQRERLESQTGPMSEDEREALEAAGFIPEEMTSAECADAYEKLQAGGEPQRQERERHVDDPEMRCEELEANANRSSAENEELERLQAGRWRDE